MKNLRKWFPLTLAFIFVFTLSNCVEKDKKPKEEEEKPKEVKTPKNIISLEQADTIYQNYTKHRLPLIENYETQQRAPSEKFEAARFVDFNYAELRNYLDYVDQEATKAGVKKVTNLRVYFANYPNKPEFADGKEVIHPRQNSIFMVPTLDKGGKNYGFYIGADGKAKLIIDREISEEKGLGQMNQGISKNHASLLPSFKLNSNLQGDQSLTYNRGHGGPPPNGDF